MTVQLETVTEDKRAPYSAMRRREDRMRTLGKAAVFRFCDGRHGFAVRTHPGYDEPAARASFDEARRFLATHPAGPSGEARA